MREGLRIFDADAHVIEPPGLFGDVLWDTPVRAYGWAGGANAMGPT